MMDAIDVRVMMCTTSQLKSVNMRVAGTGAWQAASSPEVGHERRLLKAEMWPTIA